ncbi:hypothetical protein IC006_1404 [Sulfuracidifex tepidarius]|uniref:Thermopsin n=1 Tax=Sulfuracidifex tepidarius TaxID=1294262 RepID=A0A510DV43_9CREN|nr:hypothetical protein [Sulfuracidifex tepidarius]BBG24102.1 hypothetical protein IC006_1404 [Sulfuracidifex tepidarius]
MNKIVGLAILGIFLGSVLVGILPLTTAAALSYPIKFGSDNPSEIYTLPASNVIPYYNGKMPGGLVNLFIMNTSMFNPSALTFYLYYPNGNLESEVTLSSIVGYQNLTYYSPSLSSMLFVINATPSTGTTESVKEFVGAIPNVGNYVLNDTGAKVSSVNEIALPEIFDPATIQIGDVLVVDYSGSNYTFGVGSPNNMIVSLENGLQENGFFPTSNYDEFAGRQNGSIIVSDPSAYDAGLTSEKLFLNLTYSPQYPITVYFKVNGIVNNTKDVMVYNSAGQEIYGPAINNFYGSTLALTGLFKAIAYENVDSVYSYNPILGNVSISAGTPSPTFASYPTDDFNATPPTVNNITTTLTVNDNATLQSSGYASGTENLFNITIYFSHVSANAPADYIAFNITPDYPYLINKVNVTINASAMLTYSPSAKPAYVMTFSTESEERGIITGTGYSALGLDGVGYHSTGNYPLPIAIGVPGVGYIALVEFGIWDNYTVVTVGGYDQLNVPFSNVYPYRAEVLTPQFVTYPSSPVVSSLSPYCLGVENITVKAPDDPLYTGFTANSVNAPSVNGQWDTNVPPIGASTGFHVYLFNGANLVQSLSNIYTLPEPALHAVPVLNTTSDKYYTVEAYTNTTPFYTLKLNIMLTSGTTPQVVEQTTSFAGIQYVDGLTLYVPPQDLSATKMEITYVDSDFAVYWYFNNTRGYELNYTITFNTSSLPALHTPKTAYIPQNYYNISLLDGFYAGPLGSILKIATVSTFPGMYLYYPGAMNGIFVGNLTGIAVMLSNGTTENITLTHNNVSSIIPNLELSEDSSCSGIFTTSISIPGLERVLHVTAQELNGSYVTVYYKDNISGQTIHNTTKLLLNSTAIAPIRNGTVDFIITTIKAISPTQVVVGRLPLYVVTQPEIQIADPSEAATSPSSITYLNATSVTIHSTLNYTAVITYNTTTDETNVTVYNMTHGMIYTSKVTGDALPLLARENISSPYYIGSPVNFEFTPGTTSAPYPTLMVESNGITLSLGLPVQDFVAPKVVLQNGTVLNETVNSTITVNVKDSLGDQFSATAYLLPVNQEPLRIAPYGIYVPHNPTLYTTAASETYMYNQSVQITSGSLVLNLNVTPVIKYPFFVYMQGEVHEGYAANSTTAVLGVATGYTYDPFFAPGVSLPVSLNLGGITGLEPGHVYTVYVQAYSYPGGPIMSEFPTTLEFANVTYV